MAVSRAAHMVPPPEMPVRRPSLDASSLAVAMASAAGIGSNSSMISDIGESSRTFGIKSGVQPWMGWGAKAGWEATGEPSGLRSVAMPDLSRPASAGSARTILMSGRAALIALPAPWKVPPVP